MASIRPILPQGPECRAVTQWLGCQEGGGGSLNFVIMWQTWQFIVTLVGAAFLENTAGAFSSQIAMARGNVDFVPKTFIVWDLSCYPGPGRDGASLHFLHIVSTLICSRVKHGDKQILITISDVYFVWARWTVLTALSLFYLYSFSSFFSLPFLAADRTECQLLTHTFSRPF